MPQPAPPPRVLIFPACYKNRIENKPNPLLTPDIYDLRCFFKHFRRNGCIIIRMINIPRQCLEVNLKLFKVLLITTALFLLIVVCGDDSAGPANQAPVIQSVTADPDTVNISETSRLSCIATDQNNDILVYTWSAPDGEFPVSSSGTIVLWQAPPDTGTYSVTASVSDGQLTDSETIDINVVFPSNYAPVIQSLTANPQVLSPNDITELTCVADDQDDDSLTYTWSSSDGSFPDGNSGFEVQWQAPVEFGEYYVRVMVDDGHDADQDSILITVDEPPPAPSDPGPPDGSADPRRTMRAIRGGAFYTGARQNMSTLRSM